MTGDPIRTGHMFGAVRSVVYVGPSASAREIRSLVPGVEVRPPIQRGELYEAREQGIQAFLILDGVFAHHLAVSPREVVDVSRDGALIVGASSMGALRAAECWPAGVRGSGLVYRLFRAGILMSDDEVAVAIDPAREYAAVSEALVNIRYALARAVRARIATRAQQRSVVEAAMEMFFAERCWSRILTGVGLNHAPLTQFVRDFDLKRSDALRAAAVFARLVSGGVGTLPVSSGGLPRPERYKGHNSYFGLQGEQLQSEFLVWLFGSGRYQRYVWPLVVGERELNRLPTQPEERAPALRDALAAVLARLLTDTKGFALRLWHELEFLDELDAELMQWQAIREAASLTSPGEGTLARIREEVAITHGVRDWKMLEECVEDDALFGAIPLRWITEACSLAAAARAFETSTSTSRSGAQ